MSTATQFSKYDAHAVKQLSTVLNMEYDRPLGENVDALVTASFAEHSTQRDNS